MTIRNKNVAVGRNGDIAGLIEMIGPPPALPGVPITIRTLPFWSILVTVWPLVPSLLVSPSLTYRLPCLSMAKPCGQANRPAPIALTGLPVAKSSS